MSHPFLFYTSFRKQRRKPCMEGISFRLSVTYIRACTIGQVLFELGMGDFHVKL
jgi:hypothetical protein